MHAAFDDVSSPERWAASVDAALAIGCPVVATASSLERAASQRVALFSRGARVVREPCENPWRGLRPRSEAGPGCGEWYANHYCVEVCGGGG